MRAHTVRRRRRTDVDPAVVARLPDLVAYMVRRQNFWIRDGRFADARFYVREPSRDNDDAPPPTFDDAVVRLGDAFLRTLDRHGYALIRTTADPPKRDV